MTTVIVATGNPGKLAELKDYLQVLDWTLALKPADIEVEETGKTFIENARLKASDYRCEPKVLTKTLTRNDRFQEPSTRSLRVSENS